jgi:hypothetical protein
MLYVSPSILRTVESRSVQWRRGVILLRSKRNVEYFLWENFCKVSTNMIENSKGVKGNIKMYCGKIQCENES